MGYSSRPPGRGRRSELRPYRCKKPKCGEEFQARMKVGCPRCHGAAALIDKEELDQRTTKAIQDKDEKGKVRLAWFCKGCAHSFWNALQSHCPVCQEPASQVILLPRSKRSKIRH